MGTGIGPERQLNEPGTLRSLAQLTPTSTAFFQLHGLILVGGCAVRSLVTLFILCSWSLSSAQSLSGGVVSGSGGGGLLGGTIGGLMGLESVLNTDPIDRPREFEPRLLGGVGFTFQVADLVSDSGSAEARSLPCAGFTLEAGASFLWRDRIELDLVGGWGLNSYLLSLDSVKHVIIHGSKRAEVRLAWHPRRKYEGPYDLRIGVAAGWTFQRADLMQQDEDGYLSTTTARNAVRPYLAAELGRMGAVGKDRFEMTFRYVVHPVGDKAWESIGSLGSSTASWNSADNHLAVVARYHIGFQRTERPLPSMPAVAYEERGMDTLAVMSTRRSRIVLRLWDDAEIDGDTISVILNGQAVLAGHALTREPVRLPVDLRRGSNYLTVVAHNEGAVPPNTMHCTVRRGKGREQLLIKTSRKQSQTVVFQVG